MNEQIKSILQKHPDIQQVVNSEDFKGWVLRQPPMVAEAVYGFGGTAGDVIKILDDYKSAVGFGKQRMEPSFTRAQIRDMPQEEFAKNEKRIDAALARGLVR